MAADPQLPGPHNPAGDLVDMSLDAIFKPDSVAVYGASSNDAQRLGNQLLRNVVAAAGVDVVAVNPAGGTIEGVDAHASLPSAVDLALISVPAPRVIAAVDDAVTGGAKAVIVLSSGFAEADAEGARRQEEIRRIAQGGGARLVGPNCMGVLSHLGEGRWLDGSYFWDVPHVPGGVSFVTQSGAFGGMFLAEVRRRGAGMARFLSVGNAADVSVAETLAWLGEDPMTSAIGLFVEGLGRTAEEVQRFVQLAAKITPHTPVVAIKAGRTAAGARAAASHTGSIAGTYGPVRAAFLRAGIRVETKTDDFFDQLFSAGRPRLARGSHIAIVTVSGGPSVLTADAADAAGLGLTALQNKTTSRLADLVPTFAPTGNPVDLTPQCPPQAMAQAVDAVYADPGVDGVIMIDCGLDVVELGDSVAAASRRTGLPTTAYVLDAPSVAAALVAADVPVATSVEGAVRMLQTTQMAPGHDTSQAPQARPPRDVTPPAVDDQPVTPAARAVLNEHQAKSLLGSIPLPRERLTQDVAQARAFAAELAPARVVAKASGVAHKSEGDLVRLGLDADGVVACWNDLAAAGDGAVLIAEMITGDVELIVGGLRDDLIGPVVSIGLGGVTAEVNPDVAYLLAPTSPSELVTAVSQLRGTDLFGPLRGRPPVDMAALHRIVDAVAGVLLADPDVVEVDCNPVVVTPSGQPVVLDALVVMENSAP